MLKLSEARLRAGFASQVSAAKALGMDQSQYCKYENGAHTPSLDILTKMADAFGTTIDDLVGRSGDAS